VKESTSVQSTGSEQVGPGESESYPTRNECQVPYTSEHTCIDKIDTEKHVLKTVL